jgi:hypothetical protein
MIYIRGRVNWNVGMDKLLLEILSKEKSMGKVATILRIIKNHW